MSTNTEEISKLMTNARGEKPTFMIVDDQGFIRKTMAEIIEELGGQVIAEAQNGAEAVDKYDKLSRKPDLLSIDLEMPVMDGASALKLIRSKNQDQKVVIVSTMEAKDAIQEVIKSGNVRFLAKPFSLDSVEKVFSKILAN